MPGPGSREPRSARDSASRVPRADDATGSERYIETTAVLVSIGSPRDAVSVSRVCLHSGQDILPNGNTLPLMCCLLRDDRITARGHVRDVDGPAPTSPDYRSAVLGDLEAAGASANGAVGAASGAAIRFGAGTPRRGAKCGPARSSLLADSMPTDQPCASGLVRKTNPLMKSALCRR